MRILGFSGLYHDSAAALIRDAEIVAAVQEERFSRRKHDARFPEKALRHCVEQLPEGESPDAIVYYENPLLSLDRVIKNALQRAPRGGEIWPAAAESMLGRKARVCAMAREYVDATDKVMTVEHHLSHAASAFYPSPFEEAAILVADGVGEWATTTIAHGNGTSITPLNEIRYPHSLGLLYSAFTEYCGLKVNSGEYKLMGLAPYGEPRFKELILDHLIDLKADGSFRLNTEYFGFLDTVRSTEPGAFQGLFGVPPLPFDEKLEFRHMDLAASIQAVINEAMIRLTREALRLTGSKNLCLAGGVALNCVTNGRIVKQVSELERLWIQPAAGDAGGAIGAALHVAHNRFEVPRDFSSGKIDSQKGSLLGPAFGAEEIENALQEAGLIFHRPEDRDAHDAAVVAALADGKIVGRFDGPMEFGPRALGNRSILGDPRRKDAQRHINLRIKYRESWRPFAPVVLAERAEEFFELEGESPYMLLVADVREEHRKPVDWSSFRDSEGDMIDFVNQERSTLPAITHVDYSARIQTVDSERNPEFYKLLKAFEHKTGCPVLINTSFNVRGEPIVCQPKDAIACFLNTGLDLLAIGDFLVWKHEQSDELRQLEGKQHYELD